MLRYAIILGLTALLGWSHFTFGGEHASWPLPNRIAASVGFVALAPFLALLIAGTWWGIQVVRWRPSTFSRTLATVWLIVLVLIAISQWSPVLVKLVEARLAGAETRGLACQILTPLHAARGDDHGERALRGRSRQL